MAEVRIDASKRTEFGKGASRRLRRNGLVPAVVYGSDAAVAHVALPDHDLMLALKKPQVILQLDIDGATVNVAPRDVQRDPVRRSIEHVDLVVLSQREVRERLVVGATVVRAEAAAAEAELDQVAVVMAVREALDSGAQPDDAIAQALTAVREALVAEAAAAAAAAAAEDAAEAEAASESAEGAEAAAEKPES